MDPDGNLWVSDKTPLQLYSSGGTYSTSATIRNTNKPELYQTERNSGKPEMTYTIELKPGTYDVSLHFAEIFSRAFSVGMRMFEVYIQGDMVLEDFDIYSKANRKGNRAVVVTIEDVQVDSGFLYIDFVSLGKQFTKISGIEIHAAAPTLSSSRNVPNEKILLINAGGSDYIDPDGNRWVSDESPVQYFNAGKRYSTRANITNTDKPELYQTERNRRAMTYTIDLPNGYYDVSLHYAEIFKRAFRVKSRLFDVYIQGVLVSTELDVYKLAGRKGNAAYVEVTPDVEVSDGFLTIDFIGVSQQAKLSALEIRSVEIV